MKAIKKIKILKIINYKKANENQKNDDFVKISTILENENIDLRNIVLFINKITLK